VALEKGREKAALMKFEVTSPRNAEAAGLVN